MSVQYKSYHISESEFGSSTEFYVKYVDEVAKEVIDVSKHDTNYIWDTEIHEQDYLGKNITEIEKKLKHDFDDFEDKSRNPKWIGNVISENEWSLARIKKMREDDIRDAIEKGSKKADKRYNNSKLHTDKLEEKSKKLDRAVDKAKGGRTAHRKNLSPNEIAQVRFNEYKKYSGK